MFLFVFHKLQRGNPSPIKLLSLSGQKHIHELIPALQSLIDASRRTSSSPLGRTGTTQRGLLIISSNLDNSVRGNATSPLGNNRLALSSFCITEFSLSCCRPESFDWPPCCTGAVLLGGAESPPVPPRTETVILQ